MSQLLPTPRTTLRRRAKRGSFDREVIDRILDEGLFCHVAWVTEHGPTVLPTTYGRMGDHVVMHGGVAARWLQPGLRLCVAVTLVDGLVLARSAMHHSANYRAVVLFGAAEAIVDRTEKLRALESIVDHVVPGRSAFTRAPDDAELAATAVVRVAIDEASAKIRAGGPVDDVDDLALPWWAGVLPLGVDVGAPVPDCDPAITIPEHVAQWRRDGQRR